MPWRISSRTLRALQILRKRKAHDKWEEQRRGRVRAQLAGSSGRRAGNGAGVGRGLCHGHLHPTAGAGIRLDARGNCRRHDNHIAVRHDLRTICRPGRRPLRSEAARGLWRSSRLRNSRGPFTHRTIDLVMVGLVDSDSPGRHLHDPDDLDFGCLQPVRCRTGDGAGPCARRHGAVFHPDPDPGKLFHRDTRLAACLCGPGGILGQFGHAVAE